MNETEIFSLALRQHDPVARQALLDEACGDDRQLRQRLEALLAAHEQPESFFEAPREDESGASATADWSETDPMGKRIGPYKLLQQVGEGGMGVVYMAEQVEPVRRRVALKIIKPGMDSKRVIARFEAERQALAMMDHPNIAKVLDAGTTPGGHPYFVMELVHGLPITDYCDQEQLPPRERLELFIAVCRGIQHAHQKGIIHRDLKPSNILVAEYDERPVPKIIDFGVAKAVSQQLTEKTLFTEFGQIIGTLEYMSPEQAKRNQLDVDTRTDVYSLGIVLYSLLTGDTPFGIEQLNDAAWDELLRIIREEEPPRPSVKLSGSRRLNEVAINRRMEPQRLAAVVRGDLDWIVMKSLAKDRARRYATANELADDVARHLAAQPVVARPPSTVDRCHKFLRRNRKAAILVAGLLVAVLVTGVWGWQVAARAASEAAARGQRLSAALDQASLALGQAAAAPMGRSAEWIAVETSQQQISNLLAEGPISTELERRARKLLENMEIARADRELADLLEEVVIRGATELTLESWTDMERRFRETFRKHGMNLEAVPPLEIAERIRQHPYAHRWTDALELWIATRGQMAVLGGPKLTAKDMQPWADAIYAADDDPLRSGIRRFLYQQQRDPAILDALIEDVDLVTRSPRTLAWLATMYAGAGKPEKADSIFKLALQAYPRDVMLNFDYAYTLQNQQRYEESIRIYNRCIALRPDVPGLWRTLADVLNQVNESEAADEAIARAEALESKS